MSRIIASMEDNTIIVLDNDRHYIFECLTQNDIDNGREMPEDDISIQEIAIMAYNDLDYIDTDRLHKALGGRPIAYKQLPTTHSLCVKEVFDRFFFQDLLLPMFTYHPES